MASALFRGPAATLSVKQRGTLERSYRAAALLLVVENCNQVVDLQGDSSLVFTKGYVGRRLLQIAAL